MNCKKPITARIGNVDGSDTLISHALSGLLRLGTLLIGIDSIVLAKLQQDAVMMISPAFVPVTNSGASSTDDSMPDTAGTKGNKFKSKLMGSDAPVKGPASTNSFGKKPAPKLLHKMDASEVNELTA
jgi:hypothetical protein